MNKNYAPIVVFAYDRPDHLQRTLNALANNDLACESVLYVYCDGARDWAGENQIDISKGAIARRYGRMNCTKEEYTSYLQRIAQSRKVAHSQLGFKEVHVVERGENIGLADNIVSAVTEIVNKYGRVIAFEDDIISTKGVLTFLNEALELYENDDKVMHISAYLYPHKGTLPATFFHPVPFPAGGWATWSRAWKYFTSNTEELVEYWSKDWKKFNIIGQDHLQKQLLMNLDGRLKTWYIKWYACMRRQGGLCLYPGQSMTNNIGFDNSGETSIKSDQYYIPSPKDYTKVDRIRIKCNKKAYRILRIRASGHWYSKRYRIMLLNRIKSFFENNNV